MAELFDQNSKRLLFSLKSSIIDAWLGLKYTFVTYTKILLLRNYNSLTEMNFDRKAQLELSVLAILRNYKFLMKRCT